MLEMDLLTVEEFINKHPELCQKYDGNKDLPYYIMEVLKNNAICNCTEINPTFIYIKFEKEVCFFGMCKRCNGFLEKPIVEEIIFYEK